MAPKTAEATSIRHRILDVCLRLFNEKGLPNITTAEIARGANMNEGHLHYYFNKKEQILTALFSEFERIANKIGADSADLLGIRASTLDAQQCWFVLMWRFRFFYRDDLSVNQIAPVLRRRRAQIRLNGQQQLRRVLDEMHALKLLEATEEDRAILLVNSWIVSTYWIDYLSTLPGDARVGLADLEEGIRHVDGLFTPYLTESGLLQRAQRSSLGQLVTSDLKFRLKWES